MPFSTSESWRRELGFVLLDLGGMIVAKFTEYTLPIPHGLLFPHWLTKPSPRLLITHFTSTIVCSDVLSGGEVVLSISLWRL